MNEYSYDYKARHVGHVIASNNGMDVIQCMLCGFAHRDPLPKQEELDEYYEKDIFYKTHGPRDWLYNERVEHDAGLWNSYYRRQVELIRSYTPRRSPHFGVPYIIDVGAGTGRFVKYCRDNGVFAHGSEPSKYVRDMSPVKLYETVQEISIMAPIFNVLRMSLVLEHILDPKRFLRKLATENLHCGGIVVIIVPNEFNYLQNRVRKQEGYDWFVQYPHINYFTKNSLSALVLNMGWKILYRGGTFPMEAAYLLGNKYIGNEDIGRKVHRWRLGFEKHMHGVAWNGYDLLYNLFGWGRESIIIADIGEYRNVD